MAWLLNGRAFGMEGVGRDEKVGLGDTEIWEFVNQDGAMLMIHPMHVHNVQFKIIERQVEPRAARRSGKRSAVGILMRDGRTQCS